MAIMLEQLDLQPGHRVLEIGAGTGYNAALMAHIVGEAGQIVTLDIDEDIVSSAQGRLATAGWSQVQAVCTDGAYGYPEAAPYDRIILTVAAWDIAAAWEEQLKPDGRLVLPLTIRGRQLSIALERAGDYWQSISVAPCGFMGLRGDFVAPDLTRELGPAPGLQFWSVESPSASSQTIYEWLTGPRRDLDTGIAVTAHDVWFGVEPWLSLREAGFCTLMAQGEVAEQGIIPVLLAISGENKCTFTSGVIREHELCLLMRPTEQPILDESSESTPFRLMVCQYGPNGSLATELIDQLTAWHDAGHPSVENLHVRIVPSDIDYPLSPDEYRVSKRRTQLILRWPR